MKRDARNINIPKLNFQYCCDSPNRSSRFVSFAIYVFISCQFHAPVYQKAQFTVLEFHVRKELRHMNWMNFMCCFVFNNNQTIHQFDSPYQTPDHDIRSAMSVQLLQSYLVYEVHIHDRLDMPTPTIQVQTLCE